MENDGRMGLRCIMASEQADHVALKEYATIRLMQVMAERDAAIVERDHALADKKAAITDRDSAILQRDIAFAERDAAMIERDNVLVALDSARGHRALGWSPYKRQPEAKGRGDSATMLQMSPFGGIEEPHAFASNSSMLGFMSNSEKLQPIQLHQLHHQHNQQHQQHQQQQQQQHHHQQQQEQQYHQHQYHIQQQQQHHHQQEQEQEHHHHQHHHHHHQPQPLPPPPHQQQQQQQLQGSGKPGKEDTPKAKRNRKATAADDVMPKSESKKKRPENGGQMQEGSIMPLILPLAAFHAQEAEPDMNDEMNSQMEEMQEVSYIINTPIPHCSCTGTIEPCYRWGNGGWQSACCTTTLSEHPLPMNPLKKGYRLPGRKMSAGAFQKLVRRLSQEGVDLSQPIDLKDYWSKHGTNRYVTIK